MSIEGYNYCSIIILILHRCADVAVWPKQVQTQWLKPQTSGQMSQNQGHVNFYFNVFSFINSNQTAALTEHSLLSEESQIHGSHFQWTAATLFGKRLITKFPHHGCGGSYPELQTWERRGPRRPAGSTAPSCGLRTPGLERKKEKKGKMFSLLGRRRRRLQQNTTVKGGVQPLRMGVMRVDRRLPALMDR